MERQNTDNLSELHIYTRIKCDCPEIFYHGRKEYRSWRGCNENGPIVANPSALQCL